MLTAYKGDSGQLWVDLLTFESMWTVFWNPRCTKDVFRNEENCGMAIFNFEKIYFYIEWIVLSVL